MEVERKIKHGGVVGTMKVGGTVQVEDENEQNVISVCKESERGEGGNGREECDCWK